MTPEVASVAATLAAKVEVSTAGLHDLVQEQAAGGGAALLQVVQFLESRGSY